MYCTWFSFIHPAHAISTVVIRIRFWLALNFLLSGHLSYYLSRLNLNTNAQLYLIGISIHLPLFASFPSEMFIPKVDCNTVSMKYMRAPLAVVSGTGCKCNECYYFFFFWNPGEFIFRGCFCYFFIFFLD